MCVLSEVSGGEAGCEVASEVLIEVLAGTGRAVTGADCGDMGVLAEDVMVANRCEAAADEGDSSRNPDMRLDVREVADMLEKGDSSSSPSLVLSAVASLALMSS